MITEFVLPTKQCTLILSTHTDIIEITTVIFTFRFITFCNYLVSPCRKTYGFSHFHIYILIQDIPWLYLKLSNTSVKHLILTLYLFVP